MDCVKISELLDLKNTALRNEYGWFSRISILDDFDEEYEKYLILENQKTTDLWSKLKKWKVTLQHIFTYLGIWQNGSDW